MSKSDILSFMSLNKEERLSSLKDIRSIVCGIRIFNKDVGHSSEGIIDCKIVWTTTKNNQLAKNNKNNKNSN